jgi:hypothetical protein
MGGAKALRRDDIGHLVEGARADFQILNAPSFLYIQDKYFLSNLFSTLSRISNKKYELKLRQVATRTTENSAFELTEILILMNTYMKAMLMHNHEYSLNDQIELRVSVCVFRAYFVKSLFESLRIHSSSDVFTHGLKVFSLDHDRKAYNDHEFTNFIFTSDSFF